MRTILRNKTTEFYFQGVADWTETLQSAFDFKSPERVVKFVASAGLKVDEMEIVFAFDDARFNIRVPIDERFAMKPATNDLEHHAEHVWGSLPDLANATLLDNQFTEAPNSSPGL